MSLFEGMSKEDKSRFAKAVKEQRESEKVSAGKDPNVAYFDAWEKRALERPKSELCPELKSGGKIIAAVPCRRCKDKMAAVYENEDDDPEIYEVCTTCRASQAKKAESI